MQNEDDPDISSHEPDSYERTRPFYRDHVHKFHAMDFHILQRSDLNLLSREIRPIAHSQDLILRGNVLASIGEHLSDYPHQEYAIYDEFVID
jgi:hypothetical protein